MNLKSRFINFFKDKEKFLTFFITLGVILISLGVYIMGSDLAPFIGSRLIIIGSGIFYISVVALVFVLD